jgi:hypothetical protein
MPVAPQILKRGFLIWSNKDPNIVKRGFFISSNENPNTFKRGLLTWSNKDANPKIKCLQIEILNGLNLKSIDEKKAFTILIEPNKY